MPALHGSASFRRYFIGGKPDKSFIGKAVKSINARHFTPTQDAEAVAFGWVAMTEPLADKVSQEDVFVGDMVCVGFRQDEKIVRAADIKEELKQRSREIAYERGRPLSRQEKAALKDAVIGELKSRAPIKRRVAELVWHPERAEARLFGASKAMATAIGELFAKTFQLDMEEVDTGVLMNHLGFKASRSTKDEEPKKSGKKTKPAVDDDAQDEEQDAPF